MKVYIYVKDYHGPDTLKLWEGELPAVPHVGEYISVFDGWCSERVTDVFFGVEPHPYAEVQFRSSLDEYREEVARRATLRGDGTSND